MYIGRFAPSPTGPLHFGSLIAAVASYCEAKTHQGKWLLRMEDLDKPREIKGAASTILQQLDFYGFEWDGHVLYQSQRDDAYAAALESLKHQYLVYPCTCTRKEIADSSTKVGIEGAIYPGTCLKQPLKLDAARAWRIKSPDTMICFEDAIQGTIHQNLKHDIGDFILKRADGLFAYQLAVVVDDAAQGITHIVRGADLLDSTPRQIFLQQRMGFSTPLYAHIPVATNPAGEKLSKQTLAEPITAHNSTFTLLQAFKFLGQNPPDTLQHENHQVIWQWAFAHWQLALVPQSRAIASFC